MSPLLYKILFSQQKRKMTQVTREQYIHILKTVSYAFNIDIRQLQRVEPNVLYQYYIVAVRDE